MGKPDQSPHVKKANGAKGFGALQNRKTGLPEPLLRPVQILGRKGKGSARQYQFHQLPVVLRPHLLGKKNAARPQYPPKLFWVKISVAVQHQVKGLVGKGKCFPCFPGPEIDVQRGQCLPAQSHIGGIPLGGGGLFVRVPQRQQKLSAAGIHVQQPMLRPPVAVNDRPVVPGQILALGITAVQMGKIPTLHMGRSLLGQP